MSWAKKDKNICTTLNYIENILLLASEITRCVSISGFACLVYIPTGIMSSTVGLKMCTIAADIKKSVIKKKKNHKLNLKLMSIYKNIEISKYFC